MWADGELRSECGALGVLVSAWIAPLKGSELQDGTDYATRLPCGKAEQGVKAMHLRRVAVKGLRMSRRW